MRYSILGFNQEKLIKYDIDMTDVLLMDYIQKALSQPSMIKTTKDEQPYVWLQHSKILEDLPILNIKESMLRKRIAKLVELGLIQSINIANEHKRGSRSYYTITEQFEALQMTECKKLSLVERPSVKNYTPNNKLINDNKLNKTILSKDNIVENFQFGTKQNKPKKSTLWDKCLDAIIEFTDDGILRDLLVASLRLFLENNKELDKPFYTNTFKGKLNNLSKLSDDNYEQRKIVQQTLDNGWNNFYQLKENKSIKKASTDIGYTSNRAKKGGVSSGEKF